jgi:hypothetical protein
MHSLAMVHLSFLVLNMAVSQNFIISHFSRHITNLDAQDPKAENAIVVAQISFMTYQRINEEENDV